MKASREALGDAVLESGEKNKNLWVLCSGTGDSTYVYPFKQKYPDRYVEIGIAEQNMIVTAAGISLAGKTVIATTFAIFLTGRTYDQIRQSIAYSNTNVKLVSTHAGITVGEDGATHQMLEDIGMMRSIPNMRVIVPADYAEAKKAILASIDEEGPFYVRTGRLKLPIVTDENAKFEIGKASWLKKGKDVSIIACGLMVGESLKAAEILEKEGISVNVLNMHTIKPLDEKSVLKAAEVPIVTAEEHMVANGLGSAVAELLSEKKPTRMKMVGVRDTFGESGDGLELLKKYNLSSEAIVKACKNVLAKDKQT